MRDPVHLVDAREGVAAATWYTFANNLFGEEYNAELSPGRVVPKPRPWVYGGETSYRFRSGIAQPRGVR